MNLFENNEKKTNKNKNGEKFPHWEITEVVLHNYNIVSNDYQLDSSVLFEANHLVN